MKLFEPGRLGTLSVKNRIVMAPMGISGPLVETDGSLSQRGIKYFAARGKGGVGLIMTGGGRVSQEIEYEPGLRRMRVDGVSNDGTWLRKLADALHSHGAKIAIQLNAGLGRVGSPQLTSRTGLPNIGKSGMVGPSALPFLVDPNTLTRELTVEEIERLVDSFKRAAEILRGHDIDAVGLNGHTGYLLDQFMTGLWNRRTDKYGGDLEGRLRFPLEVIRAIKQGAGTDFPVIYRFGLTHYLAGGREIEEGLEIARQLEAAGVDALNIDAGCYETHFWVHPSTYSSPGLTVDLAAMVKKAVNIPVIAVGKLGFPDLAEQVLQEGKADFIALGKALLADPEWPNKVKEKRPEDIRPCIGDFECLGTARAGKKYMSCSVNPATGKEREFAIRSARQRKSVLVIGGGPCGMEAARVAALRGHEVTLWEKSDRLGGNLVAASVPCFKQDYKDLVHYLSTQIEKLGVNIEMGKEATPELVQDTKPNVVFVATGSRPVRPNIPGMKRANVVTAADLLLGKVEVGESMVVLGGGLVGCETALYLAQGGKKVTIVEIMGSVLRDVFWASRVQLMKLLAEANAKILTNTKVLEIRETGVSIAENDSRRSTLAADNVVLATGFKPNKELWETLTERLPKVYAGGDCVEPRNVKDAIWEAYGVARVM